MVLELCSESAVSKFGDVTLFPLIPHRMQAQLLVAEAKTEESIILVLARNGHHQDPLASPHFGDAIRATVWASFYGI